jgi:3-hydroxybutyryl-CoA dehydrogenase
MVSKGKMEEISEPFGNAILERISTNTLISKIWAKVDFVVEAAVEREDLKFKIFEGSGQDLSKPEVILSTNTSSIPIGRIASRTSRPDKVIGMHFMNPVPVMKLVEVINGAWLRPDETFDTTIAKLCEKFGKTPAVASDYPGFIANRDAAAHDQ